MAATISKKSKVGAGVTELPREQLDRDLLQRMYRRMVLNRRFEERVNQAYMKQKFSGFCHLHIGQEALAVGVQETLRPNDYMISGYRSHTQAIGKGIDPKQVMAELFGKAAGCSKGMGGSMHMFSAEKRFYGGHGIVGGQVPLAVGIAFAIRYADADDICVCYCGDAALNQGQFHEAMNMAATWKLPVLCIIENNKYGMGTDITRTTSIDHLWKRALAYDMDHSDCDAMNVITVYQHVKAIVDKMRREKKPHLLEALTYRYRGHSVSDPGTYRTKEEVESYQKKDPILQLANYLKASSIASDESLAAVDQEVKQVVASAEEFADAAPEPTYDEMLKYV